ncbi:MAG: S-layer homology domain-containing protein, partial [Ruminococcaceae bacterium]|nr:S-layer homology domain-containing protein [Oscillospiraceae bacterium]
ADYADAAKVSAYAVDAMNWAIANGIIEGVSETQLSPKTTSTRAQYATILERYVNG